MKRIDYLLKVFEELQSKIDVLEYEKTVILQEIADSLERLHKEKKNGRTVQKI